MRFVVVRQDRFVFAACDTKEDLGIVSSCLQLLKNKRHRSQIQGYSNAEFFTPLMGHIYYVLRNIQRSLPAGPIS
jgi:hypothetical protein